MDVVKRLLRRAIWSEKTDYQNHLEPISRIAKVSVCMSL